MIRRGILMLKKAVTAFLVSFITSAAVSLVLHAIDNAGEKED